MLDASEEESKGGGSTIFQKLKEDTMQRVESLSKLRTPPLALRKEDSQRDQLARLDPKAIYNYFEANPDVLASALEKKSVVIAKGQMLLKNQFKQDLLKKMKAAESNQAPEAIYKKSKADEPDTRTESEIFQNFIQNLINDGELQIGVCIYFILSKNYHFPSERGKYWTVFYIRTPINAH